MRTDLIEGPRALERCESAWRALEEKVDPPPFQTYDWARTWWNHMGSGAEPWIVIAGDPPVAVAPFILRRNRGVRVLSLLGQGVSDYLGPIFDGPPRPTIEALARKLAREAKRFDLLALSSLHLPDPLRASFSVGLGRGSIERVYERCPVIATRGTWEDYLRGRRKKFRANLKRAARRVSAHGSDIDIAREEATPELLAEFEEVERESWKWEHGLAYFRLPAQREFLRQLLLENAVANELWTCRVDGTLAAFAVAFTSRQTRYYYLPSFRSRYTDAGTYLLAEMVCETFESPFSEFDLLQGDEGYKLAWATGERVVHEFASRGKSLRSGGAMLALGARWRLARSSRLKKVRETLLRRRLTRQNS